MSISIFATMKNFIYILCLILLTGCSAMEPTSPGAGDDPDRKPAQPIKGRPIVPGDKIGRPRIRVNLDYLTSDENFRGSLQITVRSMQTLEESVLTITSTDEYIEIEPMADTYEYMLILEGEDRCIEEIITIEE